MLGHAMLRVAIEDSALWPLQPRPGLLTLLLSLICSDSPSLSESHCPSALGVRGAGRRGWAVACLSGSYTTYALPFPSSVLPGLKALCLSCQEHIHGSYLSAILQMHFYNMSNQCSLDSSGLQVVSNFLSLCTQCYLSLSHGCPGLKPVLWRSQKAPDDGVRG